MVDRSKQLQSALGAAYTIGHELAGGGMASVYVAEDATLGRRVVVKAFSSAIAPHVDAQRFRREMQWAASLQHPLIVPLLSAGESDGIVYYTMPFIDGESLQQRLARQSPLPVDDALRVLRDVADALVYAHAHGVVHRDIKPGNVLLTEGHALVTDFGVAKALDTATSDVPPITHSGMTLGTPAYMAPEQVFGDAELDHRADIYSFGVLAYEMLAGKPPFASPSARALFAAHMHTSAVPLKHLRADIPPELSRLVMRCLRKDANRRWQTARELLTRIEAIQASMTVRREPSLALRLQALGLTRAAAVRRLLLVAGAFVVASAAVVAGTRLAIGRLGLPDWPLFGVGLLLLAGLGVTLATTAHVARWLSWRRAAVAGLAAWALWGIVVTAYVAAHALGIGPARSLVAAGVLRPRERILVADFIQGRAADSVLADVASEAFRIDFAQTSTVSVLPASYVRSALAQMLRPPDTPLDLSLARDIAVRNGIKAVIAGEIRPAGSGFVLSARLVSADSGNVLVAIRETASDSTHVLRALDRLSARLRDRIGESLRSIRAEPPLEAVTTSSLAALHRYTLGVKVTLRDGDVPRGVSLLEDAIALDSAFGMAYWRLGIFLESFTGAHARATRALEQAYRHRDRLTDRERHLATAAYLSRVVHDNDGAAAAYRLVLAAHPDDGMALGGLAQIALDHHRYDEAAELCRRALGGGTVNALTFATLASAQAAMGRWAEAEVTLNIASRMLPASPTIPYYRAALLGAHGDYDGADSTLRRILAAQGASDFWRARASSGLARIAAARGRLRDAERYSAEARVLDEKNGWDADALGEMVSVATWDAELRGAPARAVARLDTALANNKLATMPSMDRPYEELALALANSGRLGAASALMRERNAALPPRERLARAARAQRATAAVLAKTGRTADAVAELRRTDTSGRCAICGLPELGREYERLGMRDSAVAVYERYLATPTMYRLFEPFGGVADNDAVFLGGVHRRLAALYDERGDHARAAEQYTRLAALWQRSDPELQALVAEAQSELTGAGWRRDRDRAMRRRTPDVRDALAPRVARLPVAGGRGRFRPVLEIRRGASVERSRRAPQHPALAIDEQHVDAILVRQPQRFAERRLVDVERDRGRAHRRVWNAGAHAAVDELAHDAIAPTERRQLVDAQPPVRPRQPLQRRHPAVDVALLMALERDEHDVEVAGEIGGQPHLPPFEIASRDGREASQRLLRNR